ncbi:hypothetical protein FCV25MIE_28432 [Fagus crenata]|jgi:hypothetical protein
MHQKRQRFQSTWHPLMLEIHSQVVQMQTITHPTDQIAANNGRDNRRNGKSTFHCDYCGYNNHTKDVCNKLHGFPNDRSRNPSRNQNFSEWALVAPPLITQEQYNKILTMLCSGSTNP